ncbi:hypothetical protein C8R45DRAFT_1112221 [Mycena sanguinolenta]|nr:hypothetical protein C8R45DRAFT_1112221 [Mycena sanguinolenta]
MPYSPPGVVAPPALFHSSAHTNDGHTRPPPRSGHRRSYTFSVDAGPDTFAFLGALPRRPRSHSTNVPQRKFHFGDSDESSSETEKDQAQLHSLHPSHQPYYAYQLEPQGAEDEDDDGLHSPRRPIPSPTFRLTPMTGLHNASPPSSPHWSPLSSFTNLPSALGTLNNAKTSSASTGAFPARRKSRSASTPVILSNGKPLKSSLKSNKSAPEVLSRPSFPLRTQSAPASPNLFGVPAASPDASPPLSPKAVHFPAPDAGLEDVRLFKRSARPVSVSSALPFEDDTETETETDRDVPRIAAWGGGEYPFPKVGRSPLRQQADEREEKRWRYALHAPGLPRNAEERGAGDMARMEQVRLVEARTGPSFVWDFANNTIPEITLHGTVLARNATFEKYLFVRFTLDEWATTSEVCAQYVGTHKHTAAESGASSSCSGDARNEKHEEEEEAGPEWDRFSFSIRLTDYGAPFPLHPYAH